ncbi:YegS/Rv2252/BmrU family lipid kinase [uncultured Fusobacterium sp.]|uniref:YegS/Rv2252/BmrU family lipid kinase n=1 Tax=uncultured Fusobacterium sp. TaxID=159267 RepID=UPI0025F28514|nr:YegS/Rv2252/BmrU family lipid kinase [uncultured Fusobacterium sp.]
MKKVKFIYNPFSGENEILKHLDTIIHLYQQQSLEIVPFRISMNTPLENAFTTLDESYDHILAAGGDGTINQVVNIIKNKNIDLPLAILPVGTANDFAKHIGMSSNIEDSCKKILKGTPKDVDLGFANGKYFINVFSYGLFTDISQKTPTHLKNTIGKLAYYFNGIMELPTFKKMNISIESSEFNYDGSALIFFAFNGRTAGNINIAYKSEIDDGLLDIIIVKGDTLTKTLTSLFQFFKSEHLEIPGSFIHFRTSYLKVSCEDKSIVTDIDGEPGPSFPLNISCIKSGIKIIY